MSASELSILSLNCWGLYLVSKKRRFRLAAIADAISVANYDIVTLQEVWVFEDFEYLKNKVFSTLPFAKYYYSGTLGSGLVILSRFPIVSSSYFRYTLAGRPLKIFHGDFYVGKGCASACIEHPLLGILEVFTTHLHAGYGSKDEYEGHRITESWELSNLLRQSAAQGRQVIATGDFNSIPKSYNYRLLKEHAFMSDSWLDSNGQRMSEEEAPKDPKGCVQFYGITCDSPTNSWSKHYLKQQAHAKDIGDRLDYIFYRHTPQLSCIKASVAMTDLIPHSPYNYSDHFGVHSTFLICANSPATAQHSPLASALAHPTFSCLTPSTVHEILELLQRDQQATSQASNRLLTMFVFSIFLLLGLCAALVAVPVTVRTGWVAAVSVLVCGLAAVAFAVLATICLLSGFVFGWREQRALRQFISDTQTLLMGLQKREELVNVDE